MFITEQEKQELISIYNACYFWHIKAKQNFWKKVNKAGRAVTTEYILKEHFPIALAVAQDLQRQEAEMVFSRNGGLRRI
jgi:hypothetical protein